jgi:hypothetical protein
MPSLRRSSSGPSAARSSPYPSRSAVAASTGTGGVTGRAGRPAKRRGGSETSVRRVLADIEWWKVQAGQVPDVIEADVGEDGDQTPLDLSAFELMPLTGPDHPSTPISAEVSSHGSR